MEVIEYGNLGNLNLDAIAAGVVTHDGWRVRFERTENGAEVSLNDEMRDAAFGAADIAAIKERFPGAEPRIASNWKEGEDAPFHDNELAFALDAGANIRDFLRFAFEDFYKIRD